MQSDTCCQRLPHAVCLPSAAALTSYIVLCECIVKGGVLSCKVQTGMIKELDLISF